MSSEFTFQSELNGLALEDLEWDNTWWEQAPDKFLPRVLYIGDSISCGTRRQATFAAESKILFDGFGSSKALDNPYFEDSLRLFAKQQGYRQAVLFNNGLHGWHLEDSGSYAEYYLKTLRFLKAEFKNTPVAVVLTTAVSDPVRNERVKERNKAALSAAAQIGCHVIDLFSVSVKYSHLRSGDGVHFSDEGYTKLAEKIVKEVKRITGI